MVVKKKKKRKKHTATFHKPRYVNMDQVFQILDFWPESEADKQRQRKVYTAMLLHIRLNELGVDGMIKPVV